MDKHNYHRKLEEIYKTGLLLPGKVYDMSSFHDNWCGVYKDKLCNCNPHIVVYEVKESGEKIKVYEDI